MALFGSATWPSSASCFFTQRDHRLTAADNNCFMHRCQRIDMGMIDSHVHTNRIPIGLLLHDSRSSSRTRTRSSLSAILSESLRSNRVQACEGKRVVLQCPKNTHLIVENTFYGRLVPSSELCPSTDDGQQNRKRRKNQDLTWADRYEDTSCDVSNAHAKVVEQCKNRRKCRVLAKSSFFGRDPCPTTSKYLQISYKCKPISFDDQSFCEGTSMQLSCRQNKRLAIYSAQYGRTVNGQPMHCTLSNPVSYDCTIDVLAKLLPECHAQTECTLTVSDEHFGNPCAIGVNKYLNLIFMCVSDKIFSEAAIEGRLESMKELESSQESEATSWHEEGSGLDQLPTAIIFPIQEEPVIEPTDKSTSVSNDAAYMPIPPELAITRLVTTTTPVARIVPTICIPAHVPNAIGFMHNWLATFSYMKANKEKLILYFCLSASTGLILLLVGCIVQQCYQRSQLSREAESEPARSDAVMINRYGGSKLDLDSSTHTPLFADSDSRMGFEVNELARNGASFMRFNHLTPPRVPAVQHYYS
uniref:SUEL-type lectin domain-containing protein n=1 Tax=Plectus sambesii TaxID=2011161 RepID=A0A914VIH5_9BILA